MADRICIACGYEGKGKKQLRGSKTMEIVIWTTLLVPGPLYSIWRRSGVRALCPNCGRGHMVSLRSAAGSMARKRLDLELGVLTPSTMRKSSFSNESGVSLTDERPAEPEPRIKAPVDPDQW